MDKGILYRVTGEKFLNEAKVSAKSAKEQMPGIQTAIITDTECDLDIFDHVITKSNIPADASSAIPKPGESPFDHTLLIDSDTYFYDAVYDIFSILDNYNVSLSRNSSKRQVLGKPTPYREFNGGVVLYDDSEKSDNFLRKWRDNFFKLRESDGISRNQPALALSVYDTDLNVFVLPPEYNCFVHSIGYLTFDVKILHGRPQHTLPDAARKLNNVDGRRVYYTRAGLLSETVVKVYSRKRERIDSRFFSSARQNGLRYTLKMGILELLGKRDTNE